MKRLLMSLMLLVSSNAFAAKGHPCLIQGRVLSEAGFPVPGASVYLQGKQGLDVTVTDLSGEFSFESGQGSYTLVAHYEDRHSLSAEVKASKMPVLVEARLTEVEVERDVKVKVRALDGSKVSMEIKLRMPVAEAEKSPAQSGMINAALEGLPSGTYELVVSSPGMAYVGTLAVGEAGLKSHRDGMVISEKDYIHASQQASL